MRLASASAADAADGGEITVFASLGLAAEDLAGPHVGLPGGRGAWRIGGVLTAGRREVLTARSLG